MSINVDTRPERRIGKGFKGTNEAMRLSGGTFNFWRVEIGRCLEDNMMTNTHKICYKEFACEAGGKKNVKRSQKV